MYKADTGISDANPKEKKNIEISVRTTTNSARERVWARGPGFPLFALNIRTTLRIFFAQCRILCYQNKFFSTSCSSRFSATARQRQNIWPQNWPSIDAATKEKKKERKQRTLYARGILIRLETRSLLLLIGGFRGRTLSRALKCSE